ncbi:antitoxin [Mesorhizobium sp. 131-3-5]|uniref:type II toxin-antitoxin system Phd/YefM family antitoxin n=1 Tax=Mesorhizobium sp. 131-3-5 TaxID=2744520 RepID=UPI001928A2AF|nr:type II toxin-antitoxin system prevent-host-death family antitoxin [Mesorhizobium sp. 131-3-5]BCH10619.1 antitoxin [Mesorhizobium sp. 131-3-5]
MNVSISEAKAKLSELVRRAEAGEDIALTRHGKIVARLVSPATKGLLRRIGAFKGSVSIAEDFDKLGPEWAEYQK